MRSQRGRVVASLDSEDDGEGNALLWCMVHAGGKWWSQDRDETLEHLARWGEKEYDRGRQLEVWCTNLEYDLCNLFDPERISEVFLRFGRSALCGARWRRVEFRDTIRHVPVGVGELGELVGLKKLEVKLFRKREPHCFSQAMLTRCQRDAAITFRAARTWSGIYGGLGSRPRMTLASTALAIWRDRYWKREVRRPDREVWSAALEAYHGGRTQAFAAGTFPDVTVIDVASMFPWAMVSAPLPLPWGLYERVRRGARLEAHGIYEVTVRSELHVPRLPVRTRNGTIYPNGKWRAWYVGEELLAFQKAGGQVRVHRGYRFLETCRPFDGYVRALFRHKSRSRGLDRITYKFLLNSLYGKFGQKGRTIRAIPLARFLELKRAPLEWREWNGLAIFSTDSAPPPWGNNIWCAFITARARVRLAERIDTLQGRGCRVLYCDTDSVVFQGNGGRFPKRTPKPGEFELRGRFRRMLIVGKKEYALDKGRGKWEVHAKGVPYAERFRYLQSGEAEFQRPTRIREAARSGERVNVWRTVKKQRRTDIIKRASRADGALRVPRITPEHEILRRKET